MDKQIVGRVPAGNNSNVSSRRGARALSPAARDKRLEAMGLGLGLFARGLTGYQRDALEAAPLAELLIRALAIGDDHPLEGCLLSLAKEVEAVASLEEDSTLGELLYHWAARLYIAAELVRRYCEVRP